MSAQLFAFIQMVLQLIGLWDQFLLYGDKIRAAAAEKKSQDLDKALDQASKAATPEEAWNAQDRISGDSN